MLKFLNGHDVNGLVLANTITDSSIHNCFYETQFIENKIAFQ